MFTTLGPVRITNARGCTVMIQFLTMISQCCTVELAYRHHDIHITILSIMTLSITTLSIMILSITTFNIITLSIMGLFVTLSIIDTQHK
jgi:hypothetical protein